MQINILDKNHTIYENYSQRITTEQWKSILLNGGDTIIYNGEIYQFKVKKLGYGVLEIYKEIKNEI